MPIYQRTLVSQTFYISIKTRILLRSTFQVQYLEVLLYLTVNKENEGVTQVFHENWQGPLAGHAGWPLAIGGRN